MKRFTNKSNFCILAALLMVLPLCAQEKSAKPAQEPSTDYIACFSAWDKNMQTLQTRFTQTTEYDGVLISRSEGRIAYAQQGPKLRLDNLAEETITQTALTDKKTIFILDEKGKEISTLSWNDWLSGQPNQVLFDFGNYTALLVRHNSEVFARKAGLVILQLTPKDKEQNYILYVAVGEKDCFPQYITIQSDLMKTTAQLSDKQLNATLNQNLFKGLKK